MVSQPDSRVCTLQFREINEKWSLFGKDICRFEAVSEQGTLIAASDKITLSGFEINGPNPKNRKHKAAFDGLVASLVDNGWQQQDQIGEQWFQLSFRHK